MPRLVDLDDPRCVDARLTGAKAAALARARGHGLPVLPGVVVPVTESEPSVAHAVAALQSGGSGAARLAALEVGVDPTLLAEVEASANHLGEPVIVRSSSPLEAGGDWAGAFSTFHDVAAADLATAVRGCWTSAFSVDVLERAEAAGVAPDRLGPAVLVQPQLDCEAGGVARVLADGGVEVTGVTGSPAALLGGWEPGVRGLVTPERTVRDDAAGEVLGEATLLAVADLADRVHRVLGFDRIEWALAGGEIVLLQVQRTRASEQPPAVQPTDRRAAEALRAPVALAAARVAHRWSGPLASELVLPWALALPDLAVPGAGPAARPLDDWHRAREEAEALTRRVWGSPERAREVLGDLRGPDPAPALAELSRLRAIDPAVGARVTGLLAAVGAALRDRGALRAAEDVWDCPSRDVERVLGHHAGERAPDLRPSRLGGWETFVSAVVTVNGEVSEGTPAAGGVGAGTLRLVRNPHEPAAAGGRRPVLAAARPLPGLAPLLWDAAGLVIGADNPAAHLIEVATSVGVPTVVGVDLERLARHTAAATAVVAVDGDRGTVAVVPGEEHHRRV